MSIQFGANKLMPIYLGGSRVTSAYFGSVLVYEEVTAPDYFEFVMNDTPRFLYLRSAYTDAASKPGKCYINGTEYTVYDWELLSKGTYRWWLLDLYGAVTQGDTVRVYGIKPGVSISSNLNLCSILNDTGWDNTSGCGTSFNVTAFDRNWQTMDGLLSRSSGLNELPSTWAGCENVISIKEAFNDTSGGGLLKKIPNSFNGLNSLQTAESAFYGRRKIETGASDVSSFSALRNLTSCYRMFYNCTAWTGKAYDLYSYLSSKTSPAVSRYNGAFYGCSNAEGFSNIPSAWRN